MHELVATIIGIVLAVFLVLFLSLVFPGNNQEQQIINRIDTIIIENQHLEKEEFIKVLREEIKKRIRPLD